MNQSIAWPRTVKPINSEILQIRNIVLSEETRVVEKAAGRTQWPICAEPQIAEQDRTFARPVLSPVHRLPAELICDIFALTLFGSDCIMPEPPWALGLLALAYPTLRRDSRHMMETQLVRSANTRLHIYWELIQSDLPVPSLDLVIAESNRWKTLRLDLALSRTGDRGRLSLQRLQGPISQLRGVELLRPYAPDIVMPPVFLAAPQLNEVILIDRDFRGFCSPSILIPWCQITHFRGMYAPESQLDILAAAQNLVECALGFTTSQTGTERPPIILPRLRRLFIDQPDHLVKLTAPMLEGLSIPEVRFPTLLSFVHRSCCTLVNWDPNSRLTLVESHFPEDQATSALVFAAMTITGSAVDILPNLTSFVYGFHPGFPKPSFFSMVHSRLHPTGSAPLAYLRLYDITQDPDTLNMDAQIRSLCDHGVDAAHVSYLEMEALKEIVFCE
ncbi:hypothetical protein B0H14DRAFT_2933872 [Mycena olivaceomarginata]|nr:hypothetical protein B0H14DRAFT_2940043 [Mycena olivaceomarginata]KAJ7791921.1 hypothetical protein B0H14DRAFT_2933872 [Mycena olivaceomarginata]